MLSTLRRREAEPYCSPLSLASSPQPEPDERTVLS